MISTKNSKFIAFTGSSFDLEFGNASTNRAVEIALSFRDVGYSPYLVSLKPSCDTCQGNKERVYRSIPGTYMGEPFRALKVPTRSLYKVLNHRVGIMFNTMKFVLWLRANKKQIGHVFALSSSPTSLFIQAIACKMMRISSNYDFVEEDVSIILCGDFPIIKKILWFYQLLPLIFFKYVIVFRLFDTLTCITFQLKTLVLKLGIPERKLMVFPIVKFIEGNLSSSFCNDFKSSLYVIYTGHLSLTKDALDSLITAFAILKDRGRDVKLRIYGDGTSRTFSKLREIIIKYDLVKYVKLYGFVSREELVQSLNDAYLCVLLKRDVRSNRYNFPTKLLDYLYYKKAIIMSPLKVHLEYFSHKESALFVDVNEVTEIADMIEWALDHPKNIEQIGENGFEILRQKLNGKIVVRDYLNHLDKLGLKP